MIIKFTVIRKEGLEISRVLEVTCEIDTRMNLFDKHDVIEAIKRACDRWSKTNGGLTAYEGAGGYFNFGDFASCLGDFDLEHELNREGINDIRIDDDVDLTDYVDYDTILMSNPQQEEV